MQTNIYSVFVGKYETTSLAKKDLQKLNKLGLKGYLFSRGTHYSLKVFSSTQEFSAINLKRKLEKIGFITDIETLTIKKD